MNLTTADHQLLRDFKISTDEPREPDYSGVMRMLRAQNASLRDECAVLVARVEIEQERVESWKLRAQVLAGIGISVLAYLAFRWFMQFGLADRFFMASVFLGTALAAFARWCFSRAEE